MRIGQLNKRIQLQRISPTAQTDRYGQQKDVWETFATVWASVNPISGRELTQSRQRQSSATHAIRIRNRNDVTPAIRALLGTRVLNFESVTRPDEKPDYLTVTAIEQLTGAAVEIYAAGNPIPSGNVAQVVRQDS